MAKKPAKKSAKKSAPKRSTSRSASSRSAAASSPVHEPEYTPTPVAPMAEASESRSPVTGLLIMAVPVLIAVLLVVYRDKIFTPTASGSQETSMRSDDKKPADVKKDEKKGQDAKPADKKPADKPAEVAKGVVDYTIQAGDTFGKIAAAKGKQVKDIEALNPGVRSENLKVGQKIKIPAK